MELDEFLLLYPDACFHPQHKPQRTVVLLQVRPAVRIGHVQQALVRGSERLSGHTNGAQMRGAIPLASARHFEEQGDLTLAPAVGVAIWEHFEDALEADKAVKEFRNGGFRGPVYFMPCGGVESVYSLNAKNVAIEAMNRGYRYSDRLQVPLFKNEWGT